MYAAKDAHSRVELYDPQLDEANRTRLETIQDLDAALIDHQFVLHYQPKIDVATGATFGAEALVRWQHPTRGLLYPDAFLPVVEQSGLMSAAHPARARGRRAAARELARGRPRPQRRGQPLGVRSARRVARRADRRAARRARRAGRRARARDHRERDHDRPGARSRGPRALRGLGLRIAVDDYGTGYCALAYLRDLPIDELKIDRSFIAHVTADPRSAAIVRSTIELAHALDLKVVAEGVEHQEALDALAAFGCDFAQGYHFSRPLPAEAFTAQRAATSARREGTPSLR